MAYLLYGDYSIMYVHTIPAMCAVVEVPRQYNGHFMNPSGLVNEHSSPRSRLALVLHGTV